MALFVQPENQNIIWEMVNKIPLCNTVFPLSSKSSQHEKEDWFKEIIQECYYNIPQTISKNDLYKINREVLSKMMKSLVELSSNNNHVGIYSTLDSSQKNQTEITNIVSQYNSMFQLQKPKPIDFSEKINDDVITNMDELIENQRKIRELEVQHFSPSVPPTKCNVINILEDIPNDVIEVIEERHVRFDLSEDIFHSSKDKQYLSEEIKELSKKIENIDNNVNSIYTILQKIILDNSSLKTSENVEQIKQFINFNE